MNARLSRGTVEIDTQSAFWQLATDAMPLRKGSRMAYAFKVVDVSIPTDGRIAICLIHAGRYAVSQDGGRQSCFLPGQLFMLDCGQAQHSGKATISYLLLPHETVSGLLGRDHAASDRAVVGLDGAQIAPFLCAHMGLLGELGALLTPDAFEHMLRMAFDCACFLIRSEFGPVPTTLCRSDARLLAAHRYIEENLHRHDLDPAQVARALNCSRAQLYRLFAKQSQSVGETIKEARLRDSLRALEQAGQQHSIGTIAGLCGFSDQATFGKQFRQRFGMTPSEARRQALSSPGQQTPECAYPHRGIPELMNE